MKMLALTIVVVAACAAALAGRASANAVPLFDTRFGLSACVATPCTTTLSANEPFTVRGGFVVDDPRADLVNPLHRFELTVDGARVQGITDLDLRELSKWYVFNFRFGMTGVHTFVGCWYATDGSLIQCGTRTVTFV